MPTHVPTYSFNSSISSAVFIDGVNIVAEMTSLRQQIQALVGATPTAVAPATADPTTVGPTSSSPMTAVPTSTPMTHLPSSTPTHGPTATPSSRWVVDSSECVYIHNDAELDSYRSVTNITGCLRIQTGVTAEQGFGGVTNLDGAFPNLLTVGGYLYIGQK